MSAGVAPTGRGEERLDETQERFLRAAAARLPLERVVELHLFPPLRQGGMETGLAVIAATREPPPAPQAPESVATGASEAIGVGEPAADAASAEVPASETSATEEEERSAAPADDRLVVFSARYRLTLKGAERGRWEVEVVEEADAPLVTVDAVVRGMQRRIGEGAEPERLTADQLHALLDGPASATTGG